MNPNVVDKPEFLKAHAEFKDLLQRDVNFVAISRAPLAEIQAYQKRMGGVLNGCL